LRRAGNRSSERFNLVIQKARSPAKTTRLRASTLQPQQRVSPEVTPNLLRGRLQGSHNQGQGDSRSVEPGKRATPGFANLRRGRGGCRICHRNATSPACSPLHPQQQQQRQRPRKKGSQAHCSRARFDPPDAMVPMLGTHPAHAAPHAGQRPLPTRRQRLQA
jgi:hypothetical protein